MSVDVNPLSLAPARALRVRPGLRRVFVHDLVLEMAIGVYAAEHGRRQRVRFNIDVLVGEDARPLADQLARVLDYDVIVAGLRGLAGEPHVQLIETVAERAAALCLAQPLAVQVTVRAEKLDVLDGGATVGVEICRGAP